MESNHDADQRRLYIRNAVICFVCTAVCIGIDIRNFWRAGGIYFDWKIGVSCVLYIMLVLLGIRAVKQAGRCGKKKS